MVYREVHISDEDLLRALDGEQPARRERQIRAHMAQCWACRARSAEFEVAIQQFVCIYVASPHLRDGDGPRGLLKARLRDVAIGGCGRRHRDPPFKAARLVQAALVTALALGAVWVLLQSYGNRPRYIPNPRLTPGATRVVTRDEVCSAQATDQVHEIPAALARRVFQEYGIQAPRPLAYEVDYLITPELGGSRDIRNLWPEPYSGSEWNAHIKDALEDRLHQMVCDGAVELTTAQMDITTDWVAAYRKYFRVDHPLPEHLAFLKDRPWQ